MEKKRHIISVEVDEDTYQNLLKVAEEDDRPYGYIVRKILKNFLTNPPDSPKGNRVGTGVKGA